jgi:hypothetical protein
MTRRNRSGYGTSPQFPDVHRLDRQGAGAIDDRVDFFGADTSNLYRLPDHIGELGFPVRRSGEVPFAPEQASCFFAASGFPEYSCRDYIGVDNQPYTRPSSIALWISSRVISAPRR